MELRTKVELPVGQYEIRHADKLMLWGSCFAENIGEKLDAYKFTCDVNPFGILYNPLSIAEGIAQLYRGKKIHGCRFALRPRTMVQPDAPRFVFVAR